MNSLPVPPPLAIHDSQAAEKWKRFKSAWDNYSLATGLNAKDENVQVATLLTVIGEEARDVFTTFQWTDADDAQKIEPVVRKLQEYCEPGKNTPFERYKFYQRAQEPGESYEQYKTALRKLASTCDFASITPDEVLRDRLVFGIRDSKVRERLLRETSLTLKKADDICHAAESMATQLKLVENEASTIAAVGQHRHGKTKTRKFGRPQQSTTANCGNCGRQHATAPKEACPAFGKSCRQCGKANHFAAKCRSSGHSKKADASASVRTVAMSEDGLHVYSVGNQLDATQLVTLRLESGNYLRFQPDTGAQCNVVPRHLYVQATGDRNLRQVDTKSTSTLAAYGGSQLPVVGRVLLKVWRQDYACLLDCMIVENKELRPLLGRRACLGMGIVKYLDNDALHKPSVQDGAEVYATNVQKTPLTTEDLTKKFPKVFSDKTGRMSGEYRIRLKESVLPVQHPPRRIPVALREKVQEELQKLEDEDIISPVTTPTEWISSMVEVVKPNGKIRICLDPRNLNEAVRREHYPLPTIEDISTRLAGAKVFTKCDVRNGFWHVVLDEQSSYLTTFHTPFGRYRWKRLPFGINCAPEIFQRKMHDLIEGLNGIEVIADDFLIIGFGETQEAATRDHDEHLLQFLKRCEERGVVLNVAKLQLRQSEVPFIGHVASSQGLLVDPNKADAIAKMPVPDDKAAVQRLLGMAQYLSKFLPNLSDMTKPLRQVTQRDSPWYWGQAQQQAFNSLKTAVTSTPVLRYYSLAEEVTLQCDASKSGLGAAVTQKGQPVAYASRALTPTEERYAQIEKELLAIVFACERFELLIFGRQAVNVETDHKPLEAIFTKPLNAAPKRLQRMLLRLQKFDLRVTYKKGATMYLADTLSRAYSPEVNACEFEEKLERIDHREMLPVSADRWRQISQSSEEDSVMQQLRLTIQSGWPSRKQDVPDCVRPYFDIRDELTVQDSLIFKGQQLVVPAALRKELIESTHSSHIGVEGCIRRARDSLYWPRMSAELRDFVSRCDICMSHRSSQAKEPIIQHDFVARPWSKVGADLGEIDNRILLVVVDYFSNFVEVANVTSPTSHKVIKALQDIFARFGIPDTLVTDNGPQFSSAEFRVFAKTWGFEHKTSSPRYPQSNGKAENAVKTVKRLFAKCKASGRSEYLALLDWRNTPSEGFGSSPAQRLMGRRVKTQLPIAGKLLLPNASVESDSQSLLAAKARQQHYYNRATTPLPPIATGQDVRVQLPGQQTWSRGVCVEQTDPRSYKVQAGGKTYRRNRRHIIKSPKETPLVKDYVESPTPAEPEMVEEAPAESVGVEEDSPAPRRSMRERRSPEWLKDYVR